MGGKPQSIQWLECVGARRGGALAVEGGVL